MVSRLNPPRPALVVVSAILLTTALFGLKSATGLVMTEASHSADTDHPPLRSGAASGAPSAHRTTSTPRSSPVVTSSPAPEAAVRSPTSLPPRAQAAAQAQPAGLTASFQQLQSGLDARSVGLAYAVLGDSQVVRLGDWQSGSAWSTIKVPLSVAALRRSGSPKVAQQVHQAITESSNDSAEALWALLGGGQTAATAVNDVLAHYGDARTHTQAQRVRPAYTPFGQTTWSLTSQVTFVSNLYCSKTDTAVTHEMAHISAGQAWGLGRLEGANFKGGWGPDTAGRYLVRQFGVVTLEGRRVAVAVAVEPGGGSFAEGTRVLDTIADWLRRNLHPTSGACAHH
jgi:hypothetical protein